MITRRNLFWILVVPFLLNIVINGFIVGTGTASPGLTAYVDPPLVLDVSAGDTFDVYVTAREAVDLWLAGVQMSFDPAIIQVVDDPATAGIIEGINTGDTYPYLEFIYVQDLDNATGWLEVSVGRSIGVKTGLTGTVQIAKITFQVQAEGSSSLHLYETTLKSAPTPGPSVNMPHTTEDGYFANAEYVSSCDNNGIPKDEFNATETVYVRGGNFDNQRDVDIYVVSNTIWTDQQSIGTYVTKVTTGLTDTNLTVTNLGTLPGGSYDAVVDFDQDGVYDTGLDAVDDATSRMGLAVPKHDIRVVNVGASATEVAIGQIVSFNVTVLNEGTFTEKFNVTLYYSNQTFDGTVEEWVDQTLDAGENMTKPSDWNTQYITAGTYTIYANATVDVDDDPADNSYVFGDVTLGYRDIAITAVAPNATQVDKPNPVSIDVTVLNNGTFTETFDVTARYENDTYSGDIGTIADVALTAGISTTLPFTWDTATVPATAAGTTYNITAEASELPFETNTTNNEFLDGEVTVYKLLGVPTAIFTYSPPDPYEGQTVTFNATDSFDEPPGYIVSYTWDFGDGNFTTVTDPVTTHAYAQNGTYTVTLTVTDNDTLTDAISDDLRVYRRDVAITDVTANATLAGLGDSVLIDVRAQNQGERPEDFTITIYYDDTIIGTRSVAGLLPNYNSTRSVTWDIPTDLTPGVYTIKAVASAVPGEIDVADNENNCTVTVSIHDIAVIGITAPTTAVATGDPVALNVTVKNEGGFPETFDVLVKYDGSDIDNQTGVSLGAGNNITLDFTWDTTGVSRGNYTITAEAVIIDNNATNNVYQYDFVAVRERPVASFTHSPTLPTVGETVSFTSTSTDPDGTIVNWDWDFDDGTEHGTGETTTHVYTTTGNYTVTLNVTDNEGLWNIESKSITVALAYPVADFTWSPESPTVGETVTFNATISVPNGGSIVDYTWDFDDGNFTTVTTPIITHVFDNSGNFSVTLIIEDSEGLTGIITKSVTVEETQGLEIYMYAAVGIVIVIVAAGILVYFLKIRKPT